MREKYWGGICLPIICNQNSCAYHKLGECTLTRAASSGSGDNQACAYYVKRME